MDTRSTRSTPYRFQVKTGPFTVLIEFITFDGMITIEVNQAVDQLREAFAEFRPPQVAEALAKSLNSAMLKARKEGATEIAKVYNLRDPSTATSKMRGQKATPGNLTATLFADRLGIQLAYFAPAQNMFGKRYITVEVRKGQRKTIRSAFYVQANKGKGNEINSLFARGRYSGSAFEFRRKRQVKYPAPDTPIGLLRTTSPLSMLNDPTVREKMETVAAQHFDDAIQRQIRRLIKGRDAL